MDAVSLRQLVRRSWGVALGAALGVALDVALVACTRLGDPTLLPLPRDAIDASHVASAAGRTYQTDFTLEAAYPDDRAVLHYAQLLSRPWSRCERQPRWQSHFERDKTVHQQAHAWVNRDARRTIFIHLRYYTEGDAKQPAHPTQHVIVLEHIGVDVDDQVRQLGLECPASL
jgi:hypothetical protein